MKQNHLKKTIDTKGKKKIAENELIKYLIVSINSADFMYLNKFFFQIKQKTWDVNGLKIKFEFNNPTALKLS